jgi:hypothetical protein
MPNTSFDIDATLAAALQTRRIELFRKWRSDVLAELRTRCTDQEVTDSVEGGLRAFEDVLLSKWKADQDLRQVQAVLAPLADNAQGLSIALSAAVDALDTVQTSARPYEAEYRDHRDSRSMEADR